MCRNDENVDMFFLYVLEMLNEIHTEEFKIKKKALKKKPFVLLEITEIYILKKRLCYKIKSTDITNVLSSRIEQWGGLKPLG